MPLYEYQCENCGDVFELIQKFVDAPLTVHEKCGGAVHRLLSAPALMFKGSGWYVNDYAKGANNASNAKKGESSESSGSHSDSKSTSESKEGSSTKSEAGKAKSSENNSSSPAATTTSNSSSDKK
jgi:putative FmdB family regulatory protein